MWQTALLQVRAPSTHAGCTFQRAAHLLLLFVRQSLRFAELVPRPHEPETPQRTLALPAHGDRAPAAAAAAAAPAEAARPRVASPRRPRRSQARGLVPVGAPSARHAVAEPPVPSGDAAARVPRGRRHGGPAAPPGPAAVHAAGRAQGPRRPVAPARLQFLFAVVPAPAGRSAPLARALLPDSAVAAAAAAGPGLVLARLRAANGWGKAGGGALHGGGEDGLHGDAIRCSFFAWQKSVLRDCRSPFHGRMVARLTPKCGWAPGVHCFHLSKMLTSWVSANEKHHLLNMLGVR